MPFLTALCSRVSLGSEREPCRKAVVASGCASAPRGNLGMGATYAGHLSSEDIGLLVMFSVAYEPDMLGSNLFTLAQLNHFQYITFLGYFHVYLPCDQRAFAS